MKKLSLNIRLLIAFGVLLGGTVVTGTCLIKKQPVKYVESMKEAVELTKSWFSVIDGLKREKGVSSDAFSNVPYNYMIGNEWSEITTTLGSLEAKEIATNPDFSALVVSLLHEAKIKKGDCVGVVLSGSFPSLAVSVFAALQTMEIDAVVMSSLGSSTYGANQPEVTWIDMESRLNRDGGMIYKSSLVSIGAEEDSGKGLSEEGIIKIKNAASRNNVRLYIPATLLESIEKRIEIFKEEEIDLLINIGGNQAALGACSHSSGIPNGLNTKIDGCYDENRGLIVRMNESGVPFINMLDIKNLASQYGIAVYPGIKYSESTNLFTKNQTRKYALIILLFIELVPLYYLRKRHNLD